MQIGGHGKLTSIFEPSVELSAVQHAHGHMVIAIHTIGCRCRLVTTPNQRVILRCSKSLENNPIRKPLIELTTLVIGLERCPKLNQPRLEAWTEQTEEATFGDIEVDGEILNRKKATGGGLDRGVFVGVAQRVQQPRGSRPNLPRNVRWVNLMISPSCSTADRESTSEKGPINFPSNFLS